MSSGTQTAPLRVVIADDHPIYRDGVARAISACEDLDLVGEAEDGYSALALVLRERPDVAVLDVRMGGYSGLEVAAAMGHHGIATRVVLLSGHVDPDVVDTAMAVGAGAYLGKASSHQEICSAITRVAAGELVLDADAQASLAHRSAQRVARDPDQLLTGSEHQVLELAAQGLTAPWIAQRLALPPRVVKAHLSSLQDKLGATDRVGAVAEARRCGLID